MTDPLLIVLLQNRIGNSALGIIIPGLILLFSIIISLWLIRYLNKNQEK